MTPTTTDSMTTGLPTGTPTVLPTSPIELDDSNNTDCSSLDLIFILDSSGSAYDAGYDNWQAEIDFVKSVVNESLPSDSRVALINFSGCGSNKNLSQCLDAGKLDKMWGLNDFGTPNDHDALYQRISEMDSSDFLSGYTWTNEALFLALSEFQANSPMNRSKMIILLTDGEPFPHNVNPPHEPCIASTGYESNTLSNLKALNTVILTVGIAVNDTKVSEYLECIVDDFDGQYFEATDFNDLYSLDEKVGSLLLDSCSNTTMTPTTTDSMTTGLPTGTPTVLPTSPIDLDDYNDTDCTSL